MSDQPFNEQSDADIRQWFDVSTPPTVAGAERVEADLSAVRHRSGALRRRRVFAGGTAAALVFVGGAALVLGRGDDGSPTLVDTAAFSDQPTTSEPVDDEPVVPTTTAESDDDTSTGDSNEPGDDDTVAPAETGHSADDIPLPDLSEWVDVPWTDEDGNIDWDRFVEEQRVVFERWAEQLERWFEEHPEFGTNIDIEEWLDVDSLDEWTSKLDERVSTFDDFFDVDRDDHPWPDVQIFDGKIELDLDGDGVVDKTVEWDVPDLGELPDFEDLELPDISIPDFTDLDDIDDIDFSDVSIPDLDELDLPEEMDELLEDLRSQLDDVFNASDD